jgi:hypothetical protein
VRIYTDKRSRKAIISHLSVSKLKLLARMMWIYDPSPFIF